MLHVELVLVFCQPGKARLGLCCIFCSQCSAANSNQVGVKVLLGVFIAGENVERMAIDLDIAANREVSSSQEGVVVVDVLVLAAMKELAFDNA